LISESTFIFRLIELGEAMSRTRTRVRPKIRYYPRSVRNINGAELMHPRLFHVALYLLRAQMITNSQTRQTNRQY